MPHFTPIRSLVPLFSLLLGVSLFLAPGPSASAQEWKPAKASLMTQWASDVNPARAHPEYPRPQMARAKWLNLNGVWQLDMGKPGDTPPFGKGLPRRILVPFPVESALSGVMEHTDRLWYRRTFTVPTDWKGQRTLLHFGAVDWEAEIFINGKSVALHQGGFDPIDLDITDSLKPSGPQELVVRVFDPSDAGEQPRGKQTNKPGGIFYTATTGIWQTVWLEPAPATSIARITLTPDVDGKVLRVTPSLSSGATAMSNLTMVATAFDGPKAVGTIQGRAGTTLAVPVPGAKLWSPDRPFLYNLTVTLKQGRRELDRVNSYFGMRKIEMKKVGKFNRLLLNGKPTFQMGPLDQGFWPDGIYTAPTDAALRFDIEVTKRLGFNTIRKHVKVEPDRWYYWADRLGILVWQDMPGAGNRTPAAKAQFQKELLRMVEERRSHPSIIMWVVFNEGWGQFDTERLTRLVEQTDPSRLVNNASGWTDFKVGEVADMHNYPGPGAPDPGPNRAAVLGEFGGLGYIAPGHLWSAGGWSYQNQPSNQALTRRYEDLLTRVWDLEKTQGLCAAIYTQTTDVETELNGILTYDRALVKMDKARVSAANQGRMLPRPPVVTVVPTAREQAALWRYTTTTPPADWMKPSFDDTGWKEGESGFGSPGTLGSTVRTEWRTPDIWLRRTVTLSADTPLEKVFMTLHHDEDAQVYVNGVLATQLENFTTDYEETPLSAEARKALRHGANLIAAHCHQTSGGQYIDLGLSR